MSTLAKLRRQDDGFTLVEVLVGMTIAIIVLFATLQSLDLFTSNANQQTRVTDANDQVRRTMDRTVRDLRGASLIVRASSTDLVYYVPEPGGVRMERLCVTSDDLYYSSQVAATAPAAPTVGCATGTKVATLRSTTSTAFTYDGASTSATPGTVKNVGITFSLDASGSGRTATSTLRSSAARRSAGVLLLGPGDVDVDCNENGPLLSLSASLPNRSLLKVAYETDGNVHGELLGTVPLQVPSTVRRIVARITDAAGVTNTIEKDIECD